MITKKRLIIVGLLIVLSVVVLLFSFAKNITKVEPNDEGGPPVSGLVDTNNELLNSTTNKDFFAIQNALMTYLAEKKIDPSTKVEVTKVTPSYRDGTTLSFTIDIPATNEENLEVKINYAANPATISIPSKNYNAPLYGGQD